MICELEVVNENASELAANDKQAFGLLRKNSLGASDSSVILGVNKWKTVEELIAEKRNPVLTEEELAVGMKENVRKGADLEPIVLQKFENWSGLQVHKPEAMYRIKEYPWLTINYDGITELEGTNVPVEAKWVSPYAKNFWDLDKALDEYYKGKNVQYGSATSLKDHIMTSAKINGIPPYYYTQVQQQLMGTDSNFAYLAALFDKGWELKVFKIYEDEYVQECLLKKSKETWDKIKA